MKHLRYLSSKYLGKVAKRTRLPFSLSFQVLGAGSWPFIQEDPFTWDPQLQECLDSFTQFYLEQNGKRMLCWCPSLTTAEVSVNLSNGRNYTVIISAVQWSLIVSFISTGPMSAEAISIASNITPMALNSALGKLLSCKLIVQLADGRYCINELWDYPPSQLNLVGEINRTLMRPREALIEDRSFVVQAQIVRHLKMMQQVHKNQLQQELGVISEDELLLFEKTLVLLAAKEFIRIDNDIISYIP